MGGSRRSLARIHSVEGTRFGFEEDSYWGDFRQNNRPLDSWTTFFWERWVEPRVAYGLNKGHLAVDLAKEVGRREIASIQSCGPPLPLPSARRRTPEQHPQYPRGACFPSTRMSISGTLSLTSRSSITSSRFRRHCFPHTPRSCRSMEIFLTGANSGACRFFWRWSKVGKGVPTTGCGRYSINSCEFPCPRPEVSMPDSHPRFGFSAELSHQLGAGKPDVHKDFQE